MFVPLIGVDAPIIRTVPDIVTVAPGEIWVDERARLIVNVCLAETWKVLIPTYPLGEVTVACTMYIPRGCPDGGIMTLVVLSHP